jgi:hypothetical protein
MSKKMIIKGVGQLLAKRQNPQGTGTEVITLGNLQDLKIDMNVELEDVFGGDGLFAIDSLVKSKSIEVQATDVKFDLAALELMMGSTVVNQDDSLWVLNEQHTLVANSTTTLATATVDFGSKLWKDGNFSVRLKDSNVLLTKTSSATPSAKEFAVDANGVLTLDASLIGSDIVVNYQRKEKVDVAYLLADEVPFNVHVIHHGSFQQKDGSYQGIETELYACRAKGNFSINAARSTASATTVTLQVIDPERADGRIGAVKRYAASSRV